MQNFQAMACALKCLDTRRAHSHALGAVVRFNNSQFHICHVARTVSCSHFILNMIAKRSFSLCCTMAICTKKKLNIFKRKTCLWFRIFYHKHGFFDCFGYLGWNHIERFILLPYINVNNIFVLFYSFWSCFFSRLNCKFNNAHTHTHSHSTHTWPRARSYEIYSKRNEEYVYMGFLKHFASFLWKHNKSFGSHLRIVNASHIFRPCN